MSSSIGMMTFPTLYFYGKMPNWWQPNHQPDIIFCWWMFWICSICSIPERDMAMIPHSRGKPGLPAPVIHSKVWRGAGQMTGPEIMWLKQWHKPPRTGFSHLLMVIWGMVDYYFNHIIRTSELEGPHYSLIWAASLWMAEHSRLNSRHQGTRGQHMGP